MKVFQVNVSASGSTGRLARIIHEGLEKSGDQPFFVYGISTWDKKNSFCISSKLETHIHDQLSKITGCQGYFSFLRTIRFISVLKNEAPDIVHLHNLHGNYLCLPILFRYLKKSNVRVVITLHDCWLFTGKCPHFTSVDCKKWKMACGECPQLNVYPKSYGSDRTKKCLNDKRKWIAAIGKRVVFVPVSNWMMDVAGQSHLGVYPMLRIYNGINTSLFKPITHLTNVEEKYGIAGKFVILGVASVWNEQKGFGAFLELSKLIKSDEIIVMVGLSPKQCKNDLPPNIIGITRTEKQQDLVQLYNRADVLFNASLEESFGMTTIEALACGTPVIVRNSTACPEIVSPEVGIVIDGDNVTDIYQAICQMRERNFKKQHWAECRKKAVDNFSDEHMVEQYLNLYENLKNE